VIVCRSQAEIAKLRRVNQLVGRILAELRRMVAPGVTTRDIDTLAERLVREAGAEPAFKGYHGYPATVCASVNEQVVHGIPSTVPVGRISPEAEKLLRVTEEALFQGIDAVKPGARVSDIGAAVQHHVEAQGFSVVREFVGHGIGTSLHEEPQVANYGPGGSGPRLSEGMVIAIEPMVNAGRASVKVQSDGWTAVTTDGSLSAHFEHTVVVTREGTEILTLLAEDADRARQMLVSVRT
jgi:methionyl aminopeptidase